MKSMITSRKIYYMGKEHLIQATNEGEGNVTIFFYTQQIHNDPQKEWEVIMIISQFILYLNV